jgi:hypothetical protein
MARKTVRQFIRAQSFPERSRPAFRGSLLDPYKPYLLKRGPQGCCNGAQLSEEIKAAGYTGSASSLRRFIANLRTQHQAANTTAALALDGSQTPGVVPPELALPPRCTERMSPSRARLSLRVPANKAPCSIPIRTAPAYPSCQEVRRNCKGVRHFERQTFLSGES